jgi:hypothetical protein
MYVAARRDIQFYEGDDTIMVFQENLKLLNFI